MMNQNQSRPDLVPVLDQLCPMHAVLDATGHILHAGPTLQKLRPDTPLPGRRFLEVFELHRPRSVTTMAGLLAVSGVKLHLAFRATPRTTLKGCVIKGPEPEQLIVTLGFGMSIHDAVATYALTSADFSVTDLAVEMLYLIEAKSAAMEASRTLNLRLQSAMIAAKEQSLTDTLTGLKNRRAMDNALGRMIENCEQFALMHLDLDFFKAVNDTRGHAAGDHVLQHVSAQMLEEVRQTDIVARVGGDEFVLLFPGLTDHATLDHLAQRIIARLEKPVLFEGKTCRVSASIGTVLSSDYARPTPDRILADADVALYASKHAGRACHRFYTPDLRN